MCPFPSCHEVLEWLRRLARVDKRAVLNCRRLVRQPPLRVPAAMEGLDDRLRGPSRIGEPGLVAGVSIREAALTNVPGHHIASGSMGETRSDPFRPGDGRERRLADDFAIDPVAALGIVRAVADHGSR
jgi:hypothetical protein